MRFSCPACGGKDALAIQAQVWLAVITTGPETVLKQSKGTPTWDAASVMECRTCGFQGEADRFELMERPQQFGLVHPDDLEEEDEEDDDD